MAIERTFSILKPDATARNLTGAVNAMIEQSGLRCVQEELQHRSAIRLPAVGEDKRPHCIQIFVGHGFDGIDQTREPLTPAGVLKPPANDLQPAWWNCNARHGHKGSGGVSLEEFFDLSICLLKSPP